MLFRSYAIFGLKPELSNSYNGIRMNYWLKNVSGSAGFAYVDVYGHSLSPQSSILGGIRPRFLIG